MNQGVEEQLDLDAYVGFWKRVLINFVDFLILALPDYVLNRISVAAAESADSAVPLFIQFVLLIAFNLFMVVRFGGTPGKLIFKVRIVNEDGDYPVLKQAVIRDSFFIINAFLGVIVSLDTKPLSAVTSDLIHWSPLAMSLNVFLGWVIVIDCLIIVFTRRNRALHDMMAGTYVVKKTELDQLV
jgi:uncharacterized RDD family membrane protein YckC